RLMQSDGSLPRACLPADRETSEISGLGALPLDPEAGHAGLQRGGLEAEEDRRAARTTDFPPGLLQHRADVPPLDLLQRHAHGRPTVMWCLRRGGQLNLERWARR